MPDWRKTIRELAAEARLHRHARALSRRGHRGRHLVALYCTVAAIAMLLVGTLSAHPF